MSLFANIIYKHCTLPDRLDTAAAASYTLGLETTIRQKWQVQSSLDSFLNGITCGIASYFREKVASKAELESRLSALREKVQNMNRAARVIQRCFAKRAYQKHTEVVTSAQEHTSFTVGNGIKKYAQLASVWLKKGKFDLSNGLKGQIIWHKATELGSHLKGKGFYVFYHAHSYPITFHLELASRFDSLDRSAQFIPIKPIEAQRKFRAPGVARLFENTTAYLRSDIAKAINDGGSMDDHYRESIISCDAIEDNSEAFESCQHFFKSNCSIVDTNSSTGKSSQEFDRNFLKSYIKEPGFLDYAVGLFAKARQEVQPLPGYGMIRVIAVAKRTLDNPQTNYVWRSHAFGKICRCVHTPGHFGHDEFVATLKKHQAGKVSKCRFNNRFPQYRILAASLDKDPTKQIFNMDCLTANERETYDSIFKALKRPLEKIIKLERLSCCSSYGQLLACLKGIDSKETAMCYKSGLLNILAKHEQIIQHYMPRLERDLPKDILDRIR